MVRTQLSLTETQKRMLDIKSIESGLSMSELIRQAIDHYYAPKRDAEADIEGIRQACGAWSDRDFDGEQYVEQMRSGRRLERFEQ